MLIGIKIGAGSQREQKKNEGNTGRRGNNMNINFDINWEIYVFSTFATFSIFPKRFQNIPAILPQKSFFLRI